MSVLTLFFSLGANADITWDFSTGMQGWENVLGHDHGVRTDASADGQKLFPWIVSGNQELVGGAGNNDGHQDMNHWTNITYSPKFTINAAGPSVTWGRYGGNTPRAAETFPPGNTIRDFTPFSVHNDQAKAFFGIALVRCSDDTIVFAKWFNRNSFDSFDLWTEISGDTTFGVTEYRLAFIDAYSGSWAWGRLHDITITKADLVTGVEVKKTRNWDVQIHAKEGVAMSETVELTGTPIAAPTVTGLPVSGNLTASWTTPDTHITIAGTPTAADAGSYTVDVLADGYTSSFTLNVADAAGTGYQLVVGASDVLEIDTRFGTIEINDVPITPLSRSVEVAFETDAYAPTQDGTFTRDWEFGVCNLWFDSISIDPDAIVDLFGDNALQLCALGNINIGADMSADGLANETFPDDGNRGDGPWGDDRNGGYTHLGSWGTTDRDRGDGMGPGGGLDHDLTADAGGGGGGYGGDGGGGGDGLTGPSGNNTYGDVTITNLLPGSGGGPGANRSGGAGGGALGIKALGDVTVSGIITANGGDGRTNNGNLPLLNGGGGSGGAIRIQGVNVDISGATLEVKGGESLFYGGGGGRLAVLSSSSAAVVVGTSIDASGGTGGTESGAAGSVKVTGLTTIILAGANPDAVERATSWTDPGITEVLDDGGTPIPGATVTVDQTDLDNNIDVPGTYDVVYSYTATPPLLDSTATRQVIVVDTTAPVVTLVDDTPAGNTIVAGSGPWTDPGATAEDQNGMEDLSGDLILGSAQPDPSLALARYTFDADNGDDSSLNLLHATEFGTVSYSTDTPFGLGGKSADFGAANNAFYVDDGTTDQSVFDIDPWFAAIPENQPSMTGQWTVHSTASGGVLPRVGGATDFVATNAAIDAAVLADAGAATSLQDVINFGTGAQGRIPNDSDFPRGGGDDFALRASGMLHIPVTDYYQIGFQSDDGCSLVIEDTGAHFEVPLEQAQTGGSIISVTTTAANAANTGSFGGGTPAGDFVGAPLPTDPLLEGGSGLVEFGVAGALTADPTHNTANTAVDLTVGSVADTLNVPYDAGFNPIDGDIKLATESAPGAGDGLDAAAAFSVEMWVKADSIGTAGCPVSNVWYGNDAAAARNGWRFSKSVSDNWEFYVGDEIGDITFGLVSTTTIVADQWYHLVAVISVDKTIPASPVYTGELFVDGVSEASEILSDPPIVNRTADIRLGGITTGVDGISGENFDGCVDELAFYDKALLLADVQNHHTEGLNAARTQSYQDTVAADAPLGYWRFNEAALVIDDTVTGLIAPADTGNSSTVGRILLAAGDYPIRMIFRELGGGDYVEVFGMRDPDAEPGTVFVPLTTDGVEGEYRGGLLTVSFFAKRAGWQQGSWDNYLSKRGESQQGWQSRRAGGTDELTLTLRGTTAGDDPTDGTSTVAPDGGWHHVVQSYDGQTRRQWIDGALDFSINDAGVVPPAIGQNFTIGARDNDSSIGPDSAWYGGLMDEVHVYKTPLNDTQIQALAAGGSVVNTDVPGTYTVNYLVLDPSGNAAWATRTVTVEPNGLLPVITLAGASEVVLEAGDPYVEQGATVATGPDVDPPADLGAVADITGTVDNTVPGVYQIAYNYEDVPNGKALPVYRTVRVQDTTAPAIVLNGDATVNITEGETYADEGATATDLVDGAVTVTAVSDLPPLPIASWTFDNDDPGEFGVIDSSGNGLHGTFRDSAGTNSAGVYIEDLIAGDVGVTGGKAIDLRYLTDLDRYVEINGSRSANHPLEIGSQAFSVSMWIRGWPSSESWNCFLSKRGDGNQGWSIRRDGTQGNDFRWTTRGLYADELEDNNHPNGNNDLWHNTVVTYEPVAGRPLFAAKAIYVDGVQTATNTAGAPNGDAPTSFVLMGARDDDNGPIDRFARVRLDDINIYRTRLTQAQIDQLSDPAIGELPVPPVGSYTITYTATDSSGNTVGSPTVRTVIVDAAPAGAAQIVSIHRAGTTATITIEGAPNTTYVCKSSLDLTTGSFSLATTVPPAILTNGTGDATFNVDATEDTKFYVVED